MTEWARVAAILEQGLELPPHERDRFFERAAGGDAALAAELLALSEAHQRAEASSFIEQPLAAAEPDLVLNTLHPGQRIGAYEILEEAGRGGMGVVYRARDTRLGRDVAVKCVAEAASARDRSRLEHEARMAARLSHPAIATVYALEERDPSEGSGQAQLFLITEFVRGVTMRERIARGRIHEPELSRQAAAIAAGLAAAHRGGVAHGDLKPENIVIGDDGQIKILDFGLAETRETLPLAGGPIAGTPGYMAPEQLRGQPADPRADVFAFGTLLFEMATGRHPFAGDRGAMLEAALSRRAAFDAPDLPAPLAPIVAKCLTPDPAARYESAAGIVAALDARAAPPPGRSLWWFQVHQRTVAAFAAAAPVIVWIVRADLGRPWGSLLFLLAFVGATAVLTLRLNADFVARERPGELRRHVIDTRTRMVTAELALDALLLATAAALAGTVDWAAALLAGSAIASILALTVIEPATTRAALRK